MDFNLCKYRDIFGKPDEGVHKYRVGGYAAVDILATLTVSWIIAVYTGHSLAHITANMFLFGILLHRLFCVNTTLNVAIFGEIEPKDT